MASEKEQRRMRAMLVNFCRANDAQFYRNINLEQFGIDSGEIVQNSTVNELCNILPEQIDELCLSNCVNVSDAACWSISKNCSTIKSLNLSNCNQITNIGLRSLSLRCSEIKKLDFTNCYLLDDLALSTLAGGTWALEELLLTDCTGVTDGGVSKIARASTKLKILDLRGCSNIGDFGDKGFKDIGTYCNNLEKLNVSGCKRVEDPGLRAIAIGCPKLRLLSVAGCDEITGTSVKAICKHSGELTELSLIGGRKLTNKDMKYFLNSKCRNNLTSLDLSGSPQVTDIGVEYICTAFGINLRHLNFSGSLATDKSTLRISEYCTHLRSLDLSRTKVTDHTVHTAAQKITALTTLRLDGNSAVTNKTLMSYIGPRLEFAEMASQWIGYRPKPNAEKLIGNRQLSRTQTAKSIIIQCMFRKKKAYMIYRVKRRWWLLNKVIPRTQACWRGYIQRKRFKLLTRLLLEEKAALIIQTAFRGHLERVLKTKKLKELMFMALKHKSALLITRTYWGMLGRRKARKRRDYLHTHALTEARRRARREQCASFIQRNFRAWVASKRTFKLFQEREIKLARLALEEKMIRYIQRFMYGKLGRLRANRRRLEIALFQKRLACTKNIQRVFRGFKGRLRAQQRRREKWLEMRDKMAVEIQRIFRGGRGRIFAAIARALRSLRSKQFYAAVEMQRFIRGCLARMHVALTRDKLREEKRRLIAVLIIQRIFRGHKGKEAADIERELIKMEKLAKPLFLQLKLYEEQAATLETLLSRLSGADQRLEKEIKELEIELLHCLETTAKFTDCDKINGVPQRFLTKYLRIRLKDHYDHEKEIFDFRRNELVSKRIEMRDLNKSIETTKRELIPLTTGLIVTVKKDRSKRLRDLVRKRAALATKIQALWRRAITRVAYTDPIRSHWIECFDEEQGEKPYYYNTMSQVTSWKIPWAYRLFGNRGS